MYHMHPSRLRIFFGTKSIINLLGNIILSGLLLSMAIAANVVMVALFIEVFTGEYEMGVKFFFYVFCVAIDFGFFILLRIMYKSIWRDK